VMERPGGDALGPRFQGRAALRHLQPRNLQMRTMNHALTTLLLACTVSTTATAQVEVKLGKSAKMVALDALHGPEKAKSLAKEAANAPRHAQEYKPSLAERAALKQLAEIDGQSKADVLLEICARPFKFSDERVKAYEARTARVTPDKVGTPITKYYPPQDMVIPLIVAIRMTERGKSGQEFNVLFGPNSDSSFRGQVEKIRRLIYSLHHTVKSKGPTRFKWNYYIWQLSTTYNSGRLLHMHLLDPSEYMSLKKPIFGRVGPYRSTNRKNYTKMTKSWATSVRKYFTMFTSKPSK
jgi:hypothetical protein